VTTGGWGEQDGRGLTNLLSIHLFAVLDLPGMCVCVCGGGGIKPLQKIRLLRPVLIEISIWGLFRLELGSAQL